MAYLAYAYFFRGKILLLLLSLTQSMVHQYAREQTSGTSVTITEAVCPAPFSYPAENDANSCRLMDCIGGFQCCDYRNTDNVQQGSQCCSDGTCCPPQFGRCVNDGSIKCLHNSYIYCAAAPSRQYCNSSFPTCCPDSDSCCPASQTCSPAGCLPNGYTYCKEFHRVCIPGQYCETSFGCIPNGAKLCGNHWCPPDSSCCGNDCRPPDGSCCNGTPCPAGRPCCGSSCTPAGGSCCNGTPCPAGTKCCGQARGCIPADADCCNEAGEYCSGNYPKCCGSNHCMPADGTCCDDDGSYCDDHGICCGKWCCKGNGHWYCGPLHVCDPGAVEFDENPVSLYGKTPKISAKIPESETGNVVRHGLTHPAKRIEDESAVSSPKVMTITRNNTELNKTDAASFGFINPVIITPPLLSDSIRSFGWMEWQNVTATNTTQVFSVAQDITQCDTSVSNLTVDSDNFLFGFGLEILVNQNATAHTILCSDHLRFWTLLAECVTAAVYNIYNASFTSYVPPRAPCCSSMTAAGTEVVLACYGSTNACHYLNRCTPIPWFTLFLDRPKWYLLATVEYWKCRIIPG